MMMLLSCQCDLDLDGGALESVLPRTEGALRRCVNARRLLGRLGDSYRSMVDAVLGLCSAAWDVEIQRYYEGRGPQMREKSLGRRAECVRDEATVVDGGGRPIAVDAALCAVIHELAAIERAGWQPGDFFDGVLLDALRTFVDPLIPRPDVYDMRAAA